MYGISRNDVQWLLEHCQVCILNCQNFTSASLQPILVKEVMAQVQADLIDMRTKSDGEYVWILYLKDHLLKFSILYILKSKRLSKITYYISLFVRHLGIPGILQCDNGQEFKGALLLFLKKHNIKLINGCPKTPQIQGLVEQANAVIKDKIAKWQAVNGNGDWADSLMEICDSINNQIHKFPSAGVTLMQLMFFCKPEFQNTKVICISKEKN